jgi:cyclohexyl-isocyanide hydratase
VGDSGTPAKGRDTFGGGSYQNARSVLFRSRVGDEIAPMSLMRSAPTVSGSSDATLTVGMVLFDGLTQLDLTGPYEVLARMPNTRVHLVAGTRDVVRSEWGLRILPDVTFAEAPALDVLCVPGGWGVNAHLEDDALLDFLRAQGETARFVTSVCSGALLLGAAGLLRGYRATTHWMSLDLLPLFGAIAVAERVVRDGNRITGAGVTAGIDFGLVLAQELFGPSAAAGIQLALEYQPAPPIECGSPASAPADVCAAVLGASRTALAARRAIVERAAARLRGGVRDGVSDQL